MASFSTQRISHVTGVSESALMDTMLKKGSSAADGVAQDINLCFYNMVHKSSSLAKTKK